MTLKEKAISVVKKLRYYNYEAFFVGGCVRDMLMRIEPKDFDVTTNATPDQRVLRPTGEIK